MAFPRISSRPDVCSGKPCLRDLYLPVSLVLHAMARGETFEQMRSTWPDLEPEDIPAILTYAAVTCGVPTTVLGDNFP